MMSTRQRTVWLALSLCIAAVAVLAVGRLTAPSNGPPVSVATSSDAAATDAAGGAFVASLFDDTTTDDRFEVEEGQPVTDLPSGPPVRRVPETDMPLCMAWEPTIATDPLNQEIVAVSQGATVQISFDGGTSFTDTVVGATPMSCDDGVTQCFSNSNCNGIGSGMCFSGQCSDNTYCNLNSDCGPMTTGSCGGFFGGDPSLAFDSQGRLFLSYLCSYPNAGRDVCFTGFQPNGGGTAFNQLPGINWPRRVTVLAGRPGQNTDKEWLAADWYAGSPYTDRIHLSWIDLGGANNWEVYTSFSDDQGQSWSNAYLISPADGSEGRVWPVHNTVAPNGDVYIAYHSQPGFLPGTSSRSPDGVSGQIFVVRSSNGGGVFSTCDDASQCRQNSDCNGIGSGLCNGKSAAFGPGQADTTWNVQHFRFCDDGTTICTSNANCMGIGSGTCNAPVGAIPGAIFWTQGTAQPWVLADPDTPGRIFVVANDDPDNNPSSGDAADVFIVRSDDFGATWTNPSQVDNGPAGTFQLLPNAAIDPISGAIAVTYYDNRAGATNGGGNFLLDVMARYSFDGGSSWLPEVDINDGLFNPDTVTGCRFCGNGAPQNTSCTAMTCTGAGTTRIGEYNGVAFGECTAHVTWADNTFPGCGGTTDVWYDRDTEAGGDLDAPDITCPNDVVIDCTESTDPSNTGTATAEDECTVEPEVDSFDQVIPGACPQEETILRMWTASDKAGNQDGCQQEIEVVDDTAPDVDVPGPIQLECNSPGGVLATDPAIVAWLGMASATDDCGSAMVTDDAPALFPFSCPPGVPTDVTFTGVDQCGNSAMETSSVTVVDTSDPDVMCSVEIDELWPPDHSLVDVGFDLMATDACDANLVIDIVVTSDEDASAIAGAGGEYHCPDAVVNDDGTVLLRSERSGTGDGRIYVITATATDDCGNQSSCQAVVGVPMSQSPKKTPLDTGQFFDATDCGE